MPHPSEVNVSATKVSMITRKDNPFLNPFQAKKQTDEEEEENEERVPDPKCDDLARRRSQSKSHLQKDPRQALTQTSMTESDLRKWQRLSMSTEDRCLENRGR